jgi:isopenicillin-N N-acyltransferase-like protein
MFPTVTVSGSALERGTQQGTAVADRIRANCAATYERAAAIQGMSRAELHDRRRPLDAQLAARFPELLEEMEGIASAAGLPIDDILTLNAFPDIAHEQRCTTAIVRDRASGAPLLFQNNDAYSTYAEHMIVLHVLGEGAHTQITYAGMIGESGLSATGIAVTGNSLDTRVISGGVPFIALMRKVLEQRTVAEAVALIEDTPRSAGIAYGLVGADGDALYVETSSQRATRMPVASWAVHTNHCLSPDVRRDEAASRGDLKRSRRRLAAATKVLDQAADRDADLLMKLACGHDADVDSICQHPRPDQSAHAAWQTLYGIVIDPVRAELQLSDGIPCEHAFRSVVSAGRLSNSDPT